MKLRFDFKRSAPDLSLRSRLAADVAARRIGEDLLEIADSGRLPVDDEAHARESARAYLASAERGRT